jgi:alpha-N-arabinofuranosidase
MYMPHMGAQSVRVNFAAPMIANTLAQVSPVGGNSAVGSIDPAAQLAGLTGSASMVGKTITLTVVNPHLHDALTTEIAIGGASIAGARGTVLVESDIHAHNDFDHPNAVQPSQAKVGSPSGGRLVHNFPAASVTALTLTLA